MPNPILTQEAMRVKCNDVPQFLQLNSPFSTTIRLGGVPITLQAKLAAGDGPDDPMVSKDGEADKKKDMVAMTKLYLGVVPDIARLQKTLRDLAKEAADPELSTMISGHATQLGDMAAALLDRVKTGMSIPEEGFLPGAAKPTAAPIAGDTTAGTLSDAQQLAPAAKAPGTVEQAAASLKK